MKTSATVFAMMIGFVLMSHAAAPKPNIIYLMCDELGYYELSCMGSPNIKTPNIDRLAAEGVRFTQALAGSSVCAPTRGVLMTGKHSGHTSVRKNDGGTPLRAGEETIASVLKKVGYATGGFGKWGCGGRGSTGVPEKHGFDVFVGYYDQVHAHSYYPKYIVKNSEELPLPGNMGGSQGTNYSHYTIYDEAISFIKANKDKPFFCYLPFTPPHGIFDIPDDDPAWALYKDKTWPEQAKRFAAMVTMIDNQVGELVALLKELDLDENTIFFFCGDNGGADYFKSKEYPRGFHGANKHPETGVEFRGRKGQLYEGGLRIPMMVRWPGKIKPGRVSDLLWYFPDVLPTLAQLAGAEAPDDIDGMSIVPELLGKGKQKQHKYLYWELGGQAAVRMQNWKAVQPGRGKWELYDLAKDISETNDIADSHPDVLAKMTAYAREAHEECQQGVFHDRAIHERDRQAKYGGTRQTPKKAAPKGKAHSMPTKGMISNKNWKIAHVSSENTVNAKLAANAIDGNPHTLWHSQFSATLFKPPHDLVIDLGQVRTIKGVVYLARQDTGWNGTIKEYEVHVGQKPDAFGDPVAKGAFEKTRTPQSVKIPECSGRYIKLRAMSEINGGPWASVAELGVMGE